MRETFKSLSTLGSHIFIGIYIHCGIPPTACCGVSLTLHNSFFSLTIIKFHHYFIIIEFHYYLYYHLVTTDFQSFISIKNLKCSFRLFKFQNAIKL